MIGVSDCDGLVESNEARAYADLVDHAPSGVAERFGLAVGRFGSIHAFVAARLADSLLFNRVLALTADEPDIDARLAEITDFYARNGVPTFAVEAAPARTSQDGPGRFVARGFAPFKRTSMLCRRVERIAHPSTRLRVARATTEDAPAFAAIATSVFAFDEPIPTLLQATFQRPASWHHWMAFDGQVPVAVAMTHVVGDVAWIGWVATLPSHRGRGAQSALTAWQLEAACEAECRVVTLEASPGTKRQPGQSLRNYLRLGFAVVHDRTIYVYRGPGRA